MSERPKPGDAKRWVPSDIWLMDPDGGNLRPLGVVGRDPSIKRCWGPAWSPDGTRLAFVANRDAESANFGVDEDP